MSMFIELNPDMKLAEMRKIIKDNSAKAMVLKNKISAMDKVAKKTTILDEYNEPIFDELAMNYTDDMSDNLEAVENDGEDYEYYYGNIMEAIKSGEDLKEAIRENLPSLENGNYGNIILRILFELKNERKIYEELKEDDSEAIKEIDRLDSIIDIIEKHRITKDDDIDLTERVKNNIIFFKTVSGNVYAEQDLAVIPSEYYSAFKTLIESIEDGTFKNVKKFVSTHTTLKGVSEVKDHGIRVVFDRINKNTYIVLDIFVKRSDCDMGYMHQLTNRVANYKREVDTIKANVTDELIKNDSIILENIKNGLSSKCIVKTKGGDNHGI